MAFRQRDPFLNLGKSPRLQYARLLAPGPLQPNEFRVGQHVNVSAHSLACADDAARQLRQRRGAAGGAGIPKAVAKR